MAIDYLNLGVTTLVLVAVVLIGVIIARPSLTRQRGGKAVSFAAFFILPVAATWIGTGAHIERAKQTQFCLSCHNMEPYGRSLHVDDASWIPAAHYQNNRIPRDQACFTCHTTYTMFGDYKAKLTGLHHLWVYYVGTVPKQPKLYEPFRNRECLHCHNGARSFEENPVHQSVRAALASNQTSCLECHATIHNVNGLAQAKFWKEPRP